MVINTESLFSLEEFVHPDLFLGEVWEALHQMNAYLEGYSHSIEVDIPKGCHLINPEMISIGEGTIIDPNTYIKGPCIIGKNCQIRAGAYIRNNVITGDRCIIGHSTEIKQSIMLDKASAAHFNYIGESILGNRVNLGAGSRCANVRFDRKEISLIINGKKIATGMKRLGAIIGDRAQIGCNAVLNPGTVIGKDAFCYPCLNVGGFVPSGSVFK